MPRVQMVPCPQCGADNSVRRQTCYQCQRPLRPVEQGEREFEPELTVAPPRAVCLTRLGWLYCLIAVWGAAMFVGSVALLSVGISNLFVSYRLAHRGTPVEAQLIRKWQTGHGDCWLSYQFSASGRTVVDPGDKVPDSLYNEVKSSEDTIQVRYLPEDPSVSIPEASLPDFRFFGWTRTAFGLLFAACFGGVAVGIPWRLRQEATLASVGVPAVGTIVGMRAGMPWGPQPVSYAFQDPYGNTLVSQAAVSKQWWRTARPGQAATVLYLPDNPAKHALYAGMWFRPRGR